MHQEQQQLCQVLQSSEHNYRHSAHSIKKKKGKKQNLRKQQSSVTGVVPGTIFFLLASQSSYGKKTFQNNVIINRSDKAVTTTYHKAGTRYFTFKEV